MRYLNQLLVTSKVDFNKANFIVQNKKKS